MNGEPSVQRRRGSILAFLGFALPVWSLVLATGCAETPTDPKFTPYRSLLEIVAELDSARDADLYRFDPPVDVTGENVFRTSLLRLDKFEAVKDEPELRPAIAFARAEAHERLSNFAEAAHLYAEVAASKSGLATQAQNSLAFAQRMEQLTAPLPEPKLPLDLIAPLEERRRELETFRLSVKDDPRRTLVEIAIERLDVRKREYLWRNRSVIPDGTQRALEAAEQVARAHAESRRIYEHLLRVGDAYAEIASAQLAAVDPASHDFDAVRARNLIQAAANVYAEVAAIDGRPERDEARAAIARLEALGKRIEGEAR